MARRRALRWVWAAMVVAFCAQAAGQSIGCDGPNSAAPVVPCAEANTPQLAARSFLETELAKISSPTADELVRILESKESTVCRQPPERNTYGPLYGTGRWGCENGYTFHALCGDNYYLEKEIDVDYGMVVVYHVVVTPGSWNVVALDTSLSLTVTRSPLGDVKLTVFVSIRQKTPGASAPSSYVETLRSQYKGQAEIVKKEVLDYCKVYKEAYCQELLALAALLTQSSAVASSEPARPFVVQAKANGTLAVTTPLELSSDAVALLVVTGKVVDDLGLPVPDAEVTLTGAVSGTRTLSDGTYQLSAFGTGASLTVRRVNLSVQRAIVDLAFPTSGGVTMTGIAADGASQLTLQVTSHGIRPESVAVSVPTLGSFARGSGASPLVLDKNGNGTLVYVPPAAVPREALTETLSVGSGSTARSVAVAPVTFTVSYTDLDGTARTATASIQLCRPPVVLVQSYLGGTATWTKFLDYARSQRFDALVTGEGISWAPGNVSLSEWAKDLGVRIAEARAAYEAAGVRTAAVDVVAHSLAGVVARSLLEGKDPRGDVRRLILVGTPNHGLAWLDQEVGAPAVRWLAAHPIAAGEIHEASTFLRALAPAGARKAEYVNLVGRRPSSLSASRQGSATVQDDGIVSAASSHLDGVAEIRFDGVVHAPGLLASAPALTESPDVWARIVALLTADLPDAEPDKLEFSLRAGRQVSVTLTPQVTPWPTVTKFPSPLAPGVAVRTGEKGYASIVITRGGQAWGSVSLTAKTEILLLASSPALVRIEIVAGSARLRTQAASAEPADFEVTLDAVSRVASWPTLQPDVRVLGVGTDVVASRDEVVALFALDGPAIVEHSKGAGFFPARLIEGGAGIRIRSGGSIEDEPIPSRGWWTTGPWSGPIPFFTFPIPVMVVSLLGLVAAAIYHVRARRSFAARAARERPPAGPSAS